MIQVSHWYGRLGNNIQQCAVGNMVAEALGSSFNQTLDHDFIEKHTNTFGQGSASFVSKWFYWEGPYKEVNLPVDYIYQNMRRVCQNFIAPHLKIPQRTPLGDDTIVIHIRSGDVFDKGVVNPSQYTPNPLSFYNHLIDQFEKAIVVTEPDSHNPIIDALEINPKVMIQSSSVEEDFATLMSAKHLANSGVGTFGAAAALCSSNIKQFWCTDLHITEHLNYKMLLGTGVNIAVYDLPKNYIKVGEWDNSDQQRRMVLEM